MVVTFESMPQVLAEIYQNQERILNLLEKPKQPEADKLFTLSELIDYLPGNPAKQTVYGWVTHRKIPFEKHGALYFRKSSINKWLANGRKMDNL